MHKCKYDYLKKPCCTKATKYVVRAEDYKSKIDHIQTIDITGTDVSERGHTNQLGSRENYFCAIVDTDLHQICKQIKNHREIKKLVESVNHHKKINRVDKNSNALGKATEKFQHPELYKLV